MFHPCVCVCVCVCVEVRYDDEVKRVVYESVTLRQEFRDFDFESPWEGPEYALPNQDVGAEKASK